MNNKRKQKHLTTMENERKTVIVVGAGLGGLATGALLAVDGWRVLVIEKADRIGGRCSQGEDGFDVGASMIMFRGLIQEVLAEAGTEIIPLVRVEPGYGVRERGCQDVFDFTPEAFESRCPGSYNRWRDLLNASKEYRAMFDRISSSPTPMGDSPTKLAIRDSVLIKKSMLSLAREYFTDPFLLNAVSCHTAFVSAPSDGVGTSVLSSLLDSADQQGVWYPKGPLGMGEIAEALRRSIEKNGRGRVLTGTTVSQVIPGIGVVLETGEFERGHAIVSNVPYLPGMDLLHDRSTQKLPSAIGARELKYSFSSVNFYITLRRGLVAPPGVSGMTNLVCVGTADDLCARLLIERGFTTGAPEMDVRKPVLYIQSPGNLADPEAAALHSGKVCVLAIFPNLLDRPEGATELDVDTLRTAIITELGISQFDIASCRVCTPQLWESEHGLPHGSILGPTLTLMQVLDLRPQIRWTRGLYRVGSATHPGAGVPTVLASARLAARCVKEDLSSSPLLDSVRCSGTFGPSMNLIRTHDRREMLRYLYAFFRLMDDLVDEAPGGQEGLIRARALVARLSDFHAKTMDPDAGIRMLQRARIPQHIWTLFLEALEFDASWSVGDLPPDIDWYAHRVAGTVGEAVGYVLSPGRHLGAEEINARHLLGRSLQRFNIVRDITRDAKGRYLRGPAEAQRERARGSREMRSALHTLRDNVSIKYDERIWTETTAFAYESMAYGHAKRCATAGAIFRSVISFKTVKGLILATVICAISLWCV
jgi:phytoene dehydrogenase-like protein